MEILTLIKEFGLQVGLLLAVILALVHTIRTILSGDLVVPRYVADDKDAQIKELKTENRDLQRKLDRATHLLEEATYEVAKPALRRAVRD